MLKIDDWVHTVNDVGETIIMILGVTGGVFFTLSYIWQTIKNRAEAKHAKKINKDEGVE